MSSTIRTACVLGLAAMATSAQANRPLNTDTADTIPEHRCQFEPYAVSERSSGSPSAHGLVLQLNCGVTAHTQLGIAWSHDAAGDESQRTLAVGGKTNLIELKDDQTGVAVNYGATAAAPSGASLSGDLVFATLIVTRQFTPNLLGHVNLGTSHSRAARQQSTTWAAAFEWTVVPRVVLSGETYGDDHARPWVGAGLWFGWRENFSVNLSVGAQTSNPRVRQATAGFNFEF